MPKDETTQVVTGESSVMTELFASVGVQVTDEASYNTLIEYVDAAGARSRTARGQVTLHGRCWKLGDGLEVWAVLFEQGDKSYFADCRPAFRSRYPRALAPWELVEYDEDGEAIVEGTLYGGPAILFELQNLTEISATEWRASHLHVAVAGLAYSAYVTHYPDALTGNNYPQRFVNATEVEGLAEQACENDYVINGRVLAWRSLRNPATGAELFWVHVDAGAIRLEVIVNHDALSGQLKIGAAFGANIWLQGHVLAEADLEARYEGVDPDYLTSDFWGRLRRNN
jgi:Domain of unknown function, E. rectale Gene description (DUF3881)